jgi:hypothetical protein
MITTGFSTDRTICRIKGERSRKEISETDRNLNTASAQRVTWGRDCEPECAYRKKEYRAPSNRQNAIVQNGYSDDSPNR